MKSHLSIHPLMLQLPLRWRGFSLIELMVAMTIGLLLLAGLFGIYINVAQSARSQAALALMQGNVRYAFEIIGVDHRMAGFTGSDDAIPRSVVGTTTPQNVVNFAATSHLCPLVDLFGTKSCTDGAGPIVGYENTNPPNVCTTTNTTPCYRTGTDSLTVVRMDTENKYAVSTHTAGTSFTLPSPWPTSNPPTAGEIFVAADYTHAAVFQVRTATNPTVSYSTGTVSPGNSSTSLGIFGDINALSLYRLSGASYYIGRNPVGEPALYRDKLEKKVISSVPTAASTAEELVQGVENMQILYGVDTDTDDTPSSPAPPNRYPFLGDGSVNSYWNADQVNAGTDGTLTMPTGSSNYWKRVLSVRITLTLVSGQNEKVGTTGDKLLRKSFSNTIAIRNRLP